jgi:hypothetical protein
MNRLVLIGNGFDLAHGLKTSYKHFILWYWDQWGNRLLNALEKTDTDGLCSFKIKDNVEVLNWASVFQGWYYKRENPFIPWQTNDVINLAMKDRNLCDFTITSPLLQRICKHLEYGWVDIENEYYLLLRQRISRFRPSTEQDIKDLNVHLNTLRDYLINYLRTEEEKETEIKEEIKDKIYRPIMKDEIAVANQKFSGNRLGDSVPSNIMLLNFNYTKTPELYMKDSSQVRVNYIHGKLDNPDSVIFGYGDELDEDYKKLQELNENEALRHIKSIRYLESDCYRKVLEFIESGPFQICIMGHSCGNSDRTLLNTLFEHRNCVSVKPYFYINGQEDNFLELVQNISRNFNDMKLMRDRVVKKPYCEPLT